jgi:arsenite methyltransferase
MVNFWEYTFQDSPEFVDTFDELPLWSAGFGLLMLKHLELRPNLTVLDLGSGAGFPLIELAERLGPRATCYGLDPWLNANNRARKKIQQYGVTNVHVLDGSAASIPLPDASVDLIVSNLGINNFEDRDKAFAECKRVLKQGGQLALTTNLNRHWKSFYDVFERALIKASKPEIIPQLISQQEHRGTVESISNIFSGHEFRMIRHVQEEFTMRFLDGTAFLNHHFVKLGWLSSWQALIPVEEWQTFFPLLEQELNNYAAANGGLTLAVPMAYMEFQKG